MIRGWRQVVPNRYVIAFFAALYLLTYGLERLFVVGDEPVPEEPRRFRFLLLIFALAFHAFWRVACFHPFANRRYRSWLAISPWTFGQPLPLGPVHLVWVDFVVVGFVCMLAYLNGLFHVAWPAVCFFAVYVGLFGLHLVGDAGGFVLMVLFFVPFVAYPHRSPVIGLAVLMGLYVLLYGGFRRALRKFPWNRGYWKSDPVEELQKQAVARGLIGWPHLVLRFLGTERGVSISYGAALVVTFLATWWLHVLWWLIGGSYDVGFLRFAAVALIFVRLMLYLSPKYLPPISFFGRVFTFRWIIPGYDKVFVGPICIFVFCMVTVGACRAMGLSDVWTFELSFFMTVLTAFLMPPSLRSWRLTGEHRMMKPAISTKQAKSGGPGLLMFFEAMRYRRSGN